MRMKRKKNEPQIEEPGYFDELSPEDLIKFVDLNQEEIFRKIEEAPSKMLFFGTESNLDVLKRCEIWGWDASFKAVPLKHEFKQFHVITGYWNYRFIPLAFVLMSKKSTEDYEKVLKFLPVSNHPRMILTDFEKASIKALKKTFDELGIVVKVIFILLF